MRGRQRRAIVLHQLTDRLLALDADMRRHVRVAAPARVRAPAATGTGPASWLCRWRPWFPVKWFPVKWFPGKRFPGKRFPVN